jgi:negative regulator of sigma E activity
MTPEFDSLRNPQSHSLEDSSSGNWETSNSPLGTLDMQKRDRFELLSAYLDGEVTAAERRQVQEWLATDPQVQCLYNRLLKVRQALRAIPVPASEPVDQTVDQVFAKLDRRPKRMFVWGGAAIAAIFVGALATMFPGNNPFSPQFAQSPKPEASGEALTIALNKPLLNIPSTAAASDQSLQQPLINLQQPLITSSPAQDTP